MVFVTVTGKMGILSKNADSIQSAIHDLRIPPKTGRKSLRSVPRGLGLKCFLFYTQCNVFRTPLGGPIYLSIRACITGA
jgi:hypothetical protein